MQENQRLKIELEGKNYIWEIPGYDQYQISSHSRRTRRVITKVTPKINCLQSWTVTPLVPPEINRDWWENLYVDNGVYEIFYNFFVLDKASQLYDAMAQLRSVCQIGYIGKNIDEVGEWLRHHMLYLRGRSNPNHRLFSKPIEVILSYLTMNLATH